jgi:hypothetical protein
MSTRSPLLALRASAALAAAVAGCGDSEPEPSIPLSDAETLVGSLQSIEANVDAGSCTVAAADVQELQDQIESLPSEVNSDVKNALQEGALNLGDLVDEECQREEPTTTEETTTEETTTEEPTTTEETTTTPPTTTLPPPTTPDDGGVGPGGL